MIGCPQYPMIGYRPNQTVNIFMPNALPCWEGGTMMRLRNFNKKYRLVVEG